MMAYKFGGMEWMLYVALLESAANIRAEQTHFLEAPAPFMCKFFSVVSDMWNKLS